MGLFTSKVYPIRQIRYKESLKSANSDHLDKKGKSKRE